MNRRSLLFLLSFAFALPAYAGPLWDFTITGPMLYDGELVRESIIYRYDPDDLMTYTCNDRESPCTIPDAWSGIHLGGGGGFYPHSYSLLWGETKAVMYDGVIRGGSGPVSIWAFADGGLGGYCHIGGTSQYDVVGKIEWSWCGWLLDPVPLSVTYTPTSQFLWSSAEGPVQIANCLAPWCGAFPWDAALMQPVISLTPVALSEPGTVALLAVWFAGLALIRPRKNRTPGKLSAQ